MYKNSSYIDKVHVWGRISSVLTLLVLLGIPCVICLRLNVWPQFNDVFKALIKIIPLFYTSAVLEVCAYAPMLGSGATYLSFVTGNIANLKLPCALNAKETLKVKTGSDEAEVVSTIAVATSAIVTTIVLASGVLLLSPVLKKATAEGSVVSPAFKQVLPALFGALLAGYFAKHWKLSVFPIVFAVAILLFDGTLGTGTLVPVCMVLSILSALVIYKTGALTNGVKPGPILNIKKKSKNN